MAGISITLAGNFGKLDELKSKAKSTATSIKSAFSSDIGKAAIGGLAAGATAAFAGVVASVKKVVDEGGKLNDMMLRTGAAGAGLVVMQRAFENAGIAADSVPQALNKMQKALAGVNDEGEPTNDVFEKIGLSVAELTAMDPVAAFRKISESISAIQDPAQRAALAMQLFGKSGGEVLAVMNDPEAFAGAEKQVGSLANTLAENAGRLDAVGDAFGALEVKFQQIGAVVAVEVLPYLEEFSAWINNTDFSKVGEGINSLAQYLKMLGGVAETVLGPIQSIGDSIGRSVMDPTEADFKLAKARSDFEQRQRQQAANAPRTTGASMVDEEATRQQIAEAIAKDRQEKLAKDQAAKAAAAQKKTEAAAEDRQIAIAKKETEKKAAEAEDRRKKAAEEREDAKTRVREKLSDVGQRMEGLRVQSTIGAISDMQRIGGGGGAVASGLDYQRQLTDLQREATGYLRQLVDLNRPPLD